MAHPLPPIDQLPTETLEEILLIATNLLKDRDLYGIVTWKEHVELTRVCTKWRQTALACSQYWTTIPFIELAPCVQFPQMLARSGTAPLKLVWKAQLERRPSILADHFPAPPPLPVQHLALLLDPSRLVELHFSATLNDIKEILSHLPCAKLPILRSISIDPSQDSEVLGLQWPLRLPAQLLTTCRPSLHSIRLVNCAAPWAEGVLIETCLFPELVQLILDHLSPRVPLEVLAAILASSPRIQDLTVDSCVSIDAKSDIVGTLDPINLHSLRNLYIQEGRRVLALFYPALLHPSSTTVTIHIPPLFDGSPPVSGLPRTSTDTFGLAISSSSSRRRSSPAMHLRFNRWSTSLTLSPHTAETVLPPAYEGYRTGAFSCKVFDHRRPSSDVESLDLAAIQVQGVQELEVVLTKSNTDSDDVHGLRELLENHPQIMSIRFTGPQIRVGVRLLLDVNRAGPALQEDRTQGVLPILRILKLTVGTTEPRVEAVTRFGDSDDDSGMDSDGWHRYPRNRQNGPGERRADIEALKALLVQRGGNRALGVLHLTRADWVDIGLGGEIKQLTELAASRGTVVYWDQ